MGYIHWISFTFSEFPLCAKFTYHMIPSILGGLIPLHVIWVSLRMRVLYSSLLPSLKVQFFSQYSVHS